VDNQIDTTTGTAKLKAVFPNNDNALFPNQFVNIRLVLETRNNAVVVPAAAIQTGTNGNFIYVVDMQHPVAPTEVPGEGSKKSGSASPEAAPSNGTGAGRSGPSGRGAGGARPSQTAYPVQSRPVKVDLTQGTDVIIASGVHPGEKVVIDGQEKLRDGSKVIPTTRDITANPPASPSNGVGASGNSPDTLHKQSPSRTGQKSNGASHP
jgi:multidrug efflux system membrane fusion protein